ncbi:MAG TPA: tRNA (adenosine(37)-N6)-threonylcarbamoyltransferase complex dimerization subunit type 1 TsaB, partial [Anaerolineales bacterium]|nr:tRNA (adenosine(37)-N6)-threonylcarbamoyltransferase complex dimerization subunit type 1 TsaB [Anaerolineales bacterium]
MLLAIDTATERASLALDDGAEILAEYNWRSANNHTVELSPQVEHMLRNAGVRADALEALAVALGPGSFTGLRIGLAFAKGFALAHALPLLGVPTLDIVAHAQPPLDGVLLAVLSAGGGRAPGGGVPRGGGGGGGRGPGGGPPPGGASWGGGGGARGGGGGNGAAGPRGGGGEGG